jgi:RNA polymerase sigma-70 factor (ECF subfamily)
VDALADADLAAWFGFPVPEALEYAFRFAYRLTGKSADAEDLVQEGFMKLIARQAQRQLPPVDRPMSYLYKIIRNQHRDTVGHASVVTLPEYDIEELRDDDDGPDERAVLAMRKDSVTRAIARLSYDHQITIRLVIFEGMSRREAAEVLGVPPETVKSRLRAAKEYLRGILRTEETGAT